MRVWAKSRGVLRTFVGTSPIVGIHRRGVAIATGQKTTLVASGLRLVPRRVARRCKITEARLWVSDARLGFIGNQRKCLKRYVPFVPVPEPETGLSR